jgi:hypothetical protein
VLIFDRRRVQDLLVNPQAKMCKKLEPGTPPPHIVLNNTRARTLGHFCNGIYGIFVID